MATFPAIERDRVVKRVMMAILREGWPMQLNRSLVFPILGGVILSGLLHFRANCTPELLR